MMKIEQIQDLWKIDSVIDRTQVGNESLKFTQLHSKYYEMLSNERIKHRMLQGELKLLKLQKFEFYLQGPDEETEKKGWVVPAVGKVLRNDVPMYMDGDKDLINLTLKIGIQAEKVDLLTSIIEGLRTRGFAIKNYIDFEKFKAGG